MIKVRFLPSDKLTAQRGDSHLIIQRSEVQYSRQNLTAKKNYFVPAIRTIFTVWEQYRNGLYPLYINSEGWNCTPLQFETTVLQKGE